MGQALHIPLTSAVRLIEFSANRSRWAAVSGNDTSAGTEFVNAE